MSEINTPGAGVEEIDAAVIEDSPVVTVPIDDTLSVAGEAADAKAVGDALAEKADKSELQTAIEVNGQKADAQGKIIVTAGDTKMSPTDSTTVKAAVEAIDAKTAADIKMSDAQDAPTIAEAMEESVDRTADQIAMSATDPTTVKDAVDNMAEGMGDLGERVAAVERKTAADIPYAGQESIKQHVDAMETGAVKTVYGVGPDASGDVSPETVPYADNLSSDEMEQVDESFLARTTGGHLGISGKNAWILRLMGDRVHNGYTPESLVMSVQAMPRPTPAAITAVLDKTTFIEYVGEAGTYALEYGDGAWSEDPADYGVTVSNTPVDGDEISIVWDGENDPVMTVSAVPRTTPPEITATISRDAWVAAVSTTGTYAFTFTTTWTLNSETVDPADYGISVTNTPIAGDAITVVYVKEIRGTITQADPDALVATGWNLYNHTDGYAKVVKYSNSYGYRIDGDYTALAFAETPEGTQTSITPDANGLFTVPSDGYVIVTDGNSANTCIYPTWSDWTGGHSGDFEAYHKDEIDVSAIMSARFPYGLCRAQDVRDEINFNTKQAISRIQRMAYTEENLANVKAAGRAYEYDENYIYQERASEDVHAITLEAEYTCDDHGLEYFTGSSAPVSTEILYGQNLKDKLRRYVVTYDMTCGELRAMGT